LHVRGESRYVDDLPEPAGLLHGALFHSPLAHGRLLSLDVSAAARAPGVRGLFTAADVPNENEIGAIVKDEPLFAQGEVHHVGQPIAFVVASTAGEARAAARLIEARFEELPIVLDPREAQRRGELIVPSRRVEIGDVERALESCATVASGRVDSGGQEHLYLETQAALCLPLEGGRLRIFAGTQGPTAVQRVSARVLGLPMSSIEVEVQRLGGGFGGKEDQATPWAAMTALAAHRLGAPVKYALDRSEDMQVTGKRHPYSSDYKLGLDADGRLVAFDVTFFQNAGSAADLSPAILERSLFHATGAYHVPNARITGHSCRTNLPPFTAFRGFGGPQALFVMECALHHAAELAGLAVDVVQEQNLLRDGDRLPFGMQVERSHAARSFAEVRTRYDFEGARAGRGLQPRESARQARPVPDADLLRHLLHERNPESGRRPGAHLHRRQRAGLDRRRRDGPRGLGEDTRRRRAHPGPLAGAGPGGRDLDDHGGQHLAHGRQRRRRPQRPCGAAGLPRAARSPGCLRRAGAGRRRLTGRGARR
jgi:xanthine dehydrogenase large subunit